MQAIEIPSVWDNREKWQNYYHDQAHALLNGIAIDTIDGKDEFIHAAIRWELTQPSHSDIWIKRYFIPEVARLTNEHEDYFYDALDHHRAAERERHAEVYLRDAIARAALAANPADAAQDLQEAIANSEAMRSERPVSPIRSLSDSLPSMWSRIQAMQGQRYSGLTQETLPELDEATGGLQGLVLVGAVSGGGKTTLCLQMVLDMLERNEDVCALIVSLDMLEWRIQDRLLTNRVGLPIRTVQSGSTDNGWTYEERKTVQEGWQKLEKLAGRIRILDRQNFPHATRHTIERERTHWMDLTRTNHCIVFVDFLQLLYVPPKLRTGLEVDDYLIEEVRYLADGAGRDPVIVICESTKSQAIERGSKNNLKGSNRILMRGDLIIILSEWDATDITNRYDTNNGCLIIRGAEPDFKNEKEKHKAARVIRKLLTNRGWAPTNLKVDKARDGAEKVDFNIIHHFRKSAMSPWLEL